MKKKSFSIKDTSIKKFLQISLKNINDVIVDNPNNYIEVSMLICIGETSNATCRIDIDESELKQHTIHEQKKKGQQ